MLPQLRITLINFVFRSGMPRYAHLPGMPNHPSTLIARSLQNAAERIQVNKYFWKVNLNHRSGCYPIQLVIRC